MPASEWLRTFVAICRAGSVTAGAALRGLSQSAAGQHLSGLERNAGVPLFIRTATGVEPTRRGRELDAQWAEQLDHLEPVLVGLDGGAAATPPPSIRFGSSAEYFPFEVVPRFDPSGPAIVATFGGDDEVIGLLERGELDIAVTSTTPARRAVVKAVECGHGLSLLATFVCTEELAEGRIVELFPVSAVLPSEPWFACTRIGDVGRDHVSAFTRRLAAPRGG